MGEAIDKIAQQAQKVKGKWQERKRRGSKGTPIIGEEPEAVQVRAVAAAGVPRGAPRMPRILRAERQPRVLRFGDELGGRREAPGNQHAWKVVREREVQRAAPCDRLEALEIPHLAFTENQDPAGFEIFVKPRKREASLLDVWAGDDAVEPVPAG